MARPEKVAAVDEIRQKLDSTDAAVLTEYRGLTVDEIARLRAALRPAGTEYKIYKNTLARRAAEEAGRSDLVPLLSGPTAIAFVTGDAVLAAKALRDFAKETPTLVIKGGVLGDRTLSEQDLKALADVEPREVLLAKLAGAIKAPLTKSAGLFSAFTRNTAYGIKALIDQRVAAGETLAADEPAPAADAESAADAPPADPPAGDASADAPAEAPEADTDPPAGDAPAADAEPAADASPADAPAEADAPAAD